MKAIEKQLRKNEQRRIAKGELVEVIKLTKMLRADEVLECYKGKKLPTGANMPEGVQLLLKESGEEKEKRSRYFWFVLAVEKDKIALRQTMLVKKTDLKEPMLV